MSCIVPVVDVLLFFVQEALANAMHIANSVFFIKVIFRQYTKSAYYPDVRSVLKIKNIDGRMPPLVEGRTLSQLLLASLSN